MNIKKLNIVICHRIPERSFFFCGKQFPVCARCTGLMVGCLFYPLFIFDLLVIPLIFVLLLHIPMLIDGFTQFIYKRESNNYLRLITGLMAGISQVALLDIIAENISKYLYIFFIK